MKDLNKLIEEGKDKEYSVSNVENRIKHINILREKYPQFGDLYDDLEKFNKFILNGKKNRLR